MPSIYFYISGHGYGHASREIEVINQLVPRLPGWRVVARTSASRWLFDRTAAPQLTLIEGACDTGVVQIDSVRLDESATIRAAVDFYAGFEARIRPEAAMLERDDARLVVVDAPPLACAAAAAAGVPSVVLSNFTWDWIYEAYGAASAPGLLSTMRDAYGHAEAGWRLPLHGGFAGFERLVDVPFVARHATVPAAEVRRRLGLPAQAPLVLTSFGGYGLDAFDPLRLDCGGRWHVVVTGREPPSPCPDWLHVLDDNAVYDAGMRYEDLVAAADVVVTKPGYGIISECIANGTAMLYTSRGRFPEYDVMVAEMPRLLRCAFIDRTALLEGRWRTALETLARTPPPAERPRTDGAEVIAAMIAARVGG
ncbi:MAG: hypothetical protein ABI603_07975 [Acidobacteriota bacterium]